MRGQVRESGQAIVRKFGVLEARAYAKGFKSKGGRFGSSGRIHTDKRNSVPSYLLLACVVHHDRPGESDKRRILFLANPYNALCKLERASR